MRHHTDLTTQHIYLDEVAERFLSRLGELFRMSDYHMHEIADKLCVHGTVLKMWRRREASPSLGSFVRLAELLNYDVSGSINYQWYHGKLKASAIYRKLKKAHLTYADIAYEIGYNERYVREWLSGNNLQNAPVQLIGNLVKYLSEFEAR